VHHQDLPRTIASRVVTHGRDGIFRRQIESRVAPPASSPVFLDLTSNMRTIVQYEQSWADMLRAKTSTCRDRLGTP
jgi:hypothetical protein